MFEFIEGFFPTLFLGYFTYAFTILYCLIPILIQIVFSYFIDNKQIWKVVIMVFCTQGIVISIAQMNCEMINSIYNYSKDLGFWNVVISKNFGFNTLYSLILFAIIIGIGFFKYRSIEKKMNYKKIIALLSSYLINIVIMIFMIFKFGAIFSIF